MCDSDDSMIDDIDNTTTEELVPMESINVDIHDCLCENDPAVVELESKDNISLKLPVNMASYKRSCDKEKAENHEVEMIILNDHSKDVVNIPLKSTASLGQKLTIIKKQVHSSLQVFLSLVK